MATQRKSIFDGDKQTVYNRLKKQKGVFAMTLCIGALCNKKQAFVFVSDRKLTCTHGNGVVKEIDGPCKTFQPYTYFAAMGAGDAIHFSEIDEEIWRQFKQRVAPETYDPPNIKEVANAYKKAIADIAPRDITDPDDMGVEIIVGGYDEYSGHIYHVNEYKATRFDGLGYVVSGACTPFVEEFFETDGYSTDDELLPTILKLFLVKKRVDKNTQAVGEKTDVLIHIKGKQHAIYDNTVMMNLLEAYYEEIKESEKAILHKYQQLLVGPLNDLFK